MITGSCLCGAIRFQIDGQIGVPSHCHCSMCRKAHGAAFGTYARVERSEFRWLSGAELVETYVSSRIAERTFCRRCGSTLQYINPARPASFAIALGALDDDPGVRPDRHIFVGSKAPWYRIEDTLQRFDGDDE